MCIVTREVKDEAELIRFVRSPDGVAVPDLARKLPGRGVWVSLNRTRVAEAVQETFVFKGFCCGNHECRRRSARYGGAPAPAECPVHLLSLAKKAGEAVTGFMKVEEMLGRGRARIAVPCARCPPDGCRKLDKLAGAGVKTIRSFQPR